MAALACDQCGADSDAPFRCSACGAFLVPDPAMDHFQALGVEARPDLDPQDLERRFEERCRALHPDHAGDAPGAKARAVLHSAQVNEAWGVLRDRYRRLEYLLSRKGGASSEEDKAVPDGFLEEMMERRMELQEVAAGGDPARVAVARQELEDALQQALAPVDGHLGPAADAADLKAARRLLNKASYLRSMLRDLKDGRA